jgi:saccharopine dehydrogenase-like NADP-dependent oxidoreductase
MSETGRTRIAVLGTGRVGAAMVRDLAADEEFHVTAVDRDREALAGFEGETATTVADLDDPGRVREVAIDADLVISAVPGAMGYETLRAIIDAGRNVVDISFFGEDPFDLDSLAKERGVTAIVDCGVAPGLSNVIAGRMHARLDRMDRYVCYVGGLPAERRWPFEYQAGFSPADVIEEYTRPAKTLDVPNMIEKTLRYPGHAELMAVFREAGFFDVDPVDVSGTAVRPLDVTSKLLFDQWEMREGDEDFTVMRVIVDGVEDGGGVRYTFDLLDRYDAATGTTSMARTTGYTATIVARQVVRGLFREKGICPPEYIGRTPGCYEDLIEEAARRGIRLTVRHRPAPDNEYNAH